MTTETKDETGAAEGRQAIAAADGRALRLQTPAAVASLVLLAVIVLYAIVLVRTAWLCDDAYITYRTIDNFVAGYGLRWNVAERVQAFTHPLWMFVLAALYVITREIYLTALISSLLISLAAVVLLAWQALRRGADVLVIAAGLTVLLVSRAFVAYSTSGLENPLTHLLLVVFVAMVFASRDKSDRDLFLLALVVCLAILNRMDTALLFLPCLAVELWRHWSWKRASLVLAGFAPFVAWQTFSVIYYGYPFPNTAYAKLSTGVSQLDYWRHGLAYFENSLRWDPVTLLAIGAGVFLGLLRRDPTRCALVAGVILYLLYVIHIGGDFMGGRFLAAPLLLAVALLIEAASERRAVWAKRLAPIAVLSAGLLGATPTLLMGNASASVRSNLFDSNGVADEQRVYYPMTGLLIDTPLAARGQDRATEPGIKARRFHDPLLVIGSVGFAGFFAGPGTYVVDYHALGDPLLSRLPMVKSDPLYREVCMSAIGHECNGTWRIGHYLRNVPAGYLDSILDDENRLADDGLRKLYDDIRLITRAPIWSAQRWRAIVRMSLGHDYELGAPGDYEPTPFVDTYERHPDLPSLGLLRGAFTSYAQSGQPLKAIECLQKLVAIDAGDIAYWDNLGQLLIEHGDATQGEAALLAAINLRGAYLHPYVAYSNQLQRTGRAGEMVRLFRQLARDGDQMAEEYLRRAQVPLK